MAEPKSGKKSRNNLSFLLIAIGAIIAAYSLFTAYKDNFSSTDPGVEIP